MLSYLTTTPSTRTGLGAPTCSRPAADRPFAARDRQQHVAYAGMVSTNHIAATTLSAYSNKVWPLSPQDGSTG